VGRVLCGTMEGLIRVPVSYIAMLWMKMTLILEFIPPCVTSTHFSF